MTEDRPTTRFAELGAAGRAAVLSGLHEVEDPPGRSGLRWGPSVILRPDDKALAAMDTWTSAMQRLTGPAHWPTGATETAHITLRSLGPRASCHPSESVIASYRAAIAEAATSAEPVGFRSRALLLSPISVMLGLSPVDQAADRLAASLAQALGPDGWFEGERVRDIWYANLVHFTGAIADPKALVAAVDGFQDVTGMVFATPVVEVVCWDFDGERMSRSVVAQTPLG